MASPSCAWQSARHLHHEPDELTLDRRHLLLRKLVVAILVDPVTSDEVLEEQCAGEAGREREGVG